MATLKCISKKQSKFVQTICMLIMNSYINVFDPDHGGCDIQYGLKAVQVQISYNKTRRSITETKHIISTLIVNFLC